MQLKTIPKGMQEDVIASFWYMLRELESKAEDNRDGILMIQVEGFYRQWNAMTGDNKSPRRMKEN
jgi:hypothetical protein